MMIPILNSSISLPFIDMQWMNRFGLKDVVEIIILALLIRTFLLWSRQTKTWVLFRGVGVFVIFLFAARVANMSELVFIMDKAIGVGITAFIILFQPELRKGLEQIGQTNLNLLDNFRVTEELFNDNTVEELIKACYAMSKVKTGALIVIEQKISLSEYMRSGINIDAIISSQLLLNIFEKNTPLHDGAVVVRGNRIMAATCYLPLSDNSSVSKELGTRHRAAIGASENTDSLTIVVSEETGKVSVAYRGELDRGLDEERLRNKLIALQNKQEVVKKGIRIKKRKRKSNEIKNQTGNRD